MTEASRSRPLMARQSAIFVLTPEFSGSSRRAFSNSGNAIPGLRLPIYIAPRLFNALLWVG